MSIGGEIMEEHYDKLIQEFLKKLEDFEDRATNYLFIESVMAIVIDMYKDHFKNNGIYE